MLNISSILKHIYTGVINKDPRFTVIDDEHIIDTKTGVKIHLYDDWLKMTHDDKKVIRMNDFTQKEQEILWKLKESVTDPEKSRMKREQYPELIKARRKRLSDLYENPIPMIHKHPIEEDNTDEYTG